MTIAKLLEQKNMSIYKCAKDSKIPYTTMLEIAKGKRSIEKCSADIVYKLAKTLEISMEELIEKYSIPYRVDFEAFKSNICHAVKRMGDVDFIIDILKSKSIEHYWELEWYPESFYLLAMVDYLSRLNNVPLCNRYDKMRTGKMVNIIYPRDAVLLKKIDQNSDIYERCKREAIPEFLKYNIIESEVRNVY